MFKLEQKLRKSELNGSSVEELGAPPSFPSWLIDAFKYLKIDIKRSKVGPGGDKCSKMGPNVTKRGQMGPNGVKQG